MRNTITGNIFEKTLIPSLEANGYSFERQKVVGIRPNGGKHIADLVVVNCVSGKTILSAKWQQVSGTAEQKVPYEIICLADILKDGQYVRAYIILGGDGWTLKDYYFSGALQNIIIGTENVYIVSLDTILSKINRKTL